jgi:hypothetical protein
MSNSKQSLTDNNLRIIRNPSPDLSNSPLSDSSKELTWSDVEHVDDNRMTHSQLLGTSQESNPENVPFPDPQPMNVIITPTFQEASTNTDEHINNIKQGDDDNNKETNIEDTNNENTKENIQTETKQESIEETPTTELPSVTMTDIDIRQLIHNAVAEAFCEVIGDVLKTIKEMEQNADENVKNDDANDVAKQPMEEDPYADMPALVEDVNEPLNENNTQDSPAAESDSQEEQTQEQEIDMYENGKIAIYEEPTCKRCATVLDLLLTHQQNKLMKRLRGIEEPEDESITEDSEEGWETEETIYESSTDDSTSDDNASEDEASAESSEQYSSDTTASSDSSYEKRSSRARRHYHEHDVPPLITFCFVLLMCLYMVRLISMMYEPAAYYRIHYS